MLIKMIRSNSSDYNGEVTAHMTRIGYCEKNGKYKAVNALGFDATVVANV